MAFRTNTRVVDFVFKGVEPELSHAEDMHHVLSRDCVPDMQLKPGVLGVKRLYGEISSDGGDCLKTCDERQLFFIKQWMEETRKQAYNEAFDQALRRGEINGLEQHFMNIKLRSLIKDWLRTEGGKKLLQRLSNAVSGAYSSETIKVRPYRKLKKNDLMVEIKEHLLFKRRGGASTTQLKRSHDLLNVIGDAITQSLSGTGLSGNGFIALVDTYIQTNDEVHVTWTKEVLADLKLKAACGKVLCGADNWVTQMCDDILAKRGLQ